MRATFFKNIKTLSGKCPVGNMVFNSVKNHAICIVRNFVKPRLTENNELAGEKMRAAAILWKLIPLDFVKDLKRYAGAFNAQLLNESTLYLSAYNIFNMAVLKHPLPFISLSELTSVLGNNLEEWIDFGFLPRVKVTQPFTEAVL